LQTHPTYSAGEKGGFVMERSQMSKVLHSAGEPGAARCSDVATGSNARASAAAQRVARALEAYRLAQFPCPAQEYGPGQVSGLSFAAELLRKARDCNGSEFQLRNSVAEAGRVMLLSPPGGTVDRQNAAYAFMEAVASLLVFAARHCDFESYLAAKIKAAEVAGEQYAARRQSERTALGKRLAAARARARLARSNSGSAQHAAQRGAA
jgi:hypothetical protein